MKNLFLAITLLVSNITFSQEFYDMNTIQTIEITFAESNWDQLLDAQKNGAEDYTMAQSVSINGTVFDSVGVKYKGNSTYNSNQTKNPFHIELDTYKDHIYEAYTDIKLSNVAKDPSFLREVLSYQILRQYMDAPLSNYANVYVNGQHLGLYSNSEAITKKFANDRFGSKSNTFIKCNPPEGAGPQSNDFPNLEYLGIDSTNYYDAYELKSDFGWSDLIDLCDTLENHVDAIEEIIDVDRVLWMLVFDNLLVNLDSYIGSFKQNYYLYRDDYGRFLPVVWDLNESFGKFANAGGGVNLNGTTAKQRMDHLLHDTDSSFPLISQILSDPRYKKMYLAHFKTMLLENFENGSYYQTGLELQSLIDEDVQNDNNKFFSYANFTSNLTSDVSGGGGPGGGSTPGITNLMDGRTTYLLGLSDFTTTEPNIADINLSLETPAIGQNVTITASITDANYAYVGYHLDEEAPFTKVEMTEDNGVYSVTIPILGSSTQYYIYAENDDIGMFSPRRAEYEYHEINAEISTPVVGDLVVNEFMASNDITQADQDEEFDDWIELYNNSSQTIDLSGYSLSDNDDDITKWTFPEGTEIDGNDYLIIWADSDEEQNGLHTNFKLSASGERIILTNRDLEVVDEISYDEQTTDISYGRYPNGTGDFQSMVPTFDAENSGISNISENQLSHIKIVPNPAQNHFSIELEETTKQEISVMNIIGKVVLEKTYKKGETIDCSDWDTGVYLVTFNGQAMKLIVW